MSNEIEKPKKKSLAVMSDEFIEMMGKISKIDAQIDSDETLTDEQRAELEKQICEVVAGKGHEIKNKVESIDYFIGMLNDARAKLTQRRADIDRANKTIDNRISSIKKYVLECMKSIGANEIKNDILTISYQKQGAKEPVIIDDEAFIPFEYKKYSITIKNLSKQNIKSMDEYLKNNGFGAFISSCDVDKDSIRESIKAGSKISGAHIGEQSEGIRIKIKSI